MTRVRFGGDVLSVGPRTSHDYYFTPSRLFYQGFGEIDPLDSRWTSNIEKEWTSQWMLNVAYSLALTSRHVRRNQRQQE